MFRMYLPGRCLTLTLLGSGCLFVASLTASPPVRAVPVKESGLIQYQAPDGATYSALVLPSPALPKVTAVPHDHVVIVDTSASQAGSFRARSIAVAAEFCRALPAGDRVQLLATDVATEVLTTEFVTAGSEGLKAAFDRLEDRVPLGASDVELALRTALQKMSGDRGRSVLFIGDGFSTAQMIQTAAFKELVTALRSAAVPVNSFAIGPRTDMLLLGSLAQHTGGVVVVDESNQTVNPAPKAGDVAAVAGQLAKAAVAPVFYPIKLTSVPEVPGLFPQPLPPIRFDRETVLLSKDLPGDKVQVKLTGRIGAEARELSWQLAKEEHERSTAFVRQAWILADNTKGVAVPWAGRDLLDRDQQEFYAQLETLQDAGVESLGRKNVQEVEEIVKSLQQLDPNNQAALQLLKSARKLKVTPMKGQRLLARPGDKPAEPNTAAPADPPKNATEKTDKAKPKNDSLLDELETKLKVREEQLTIEVSLAIEAARLEFRGSYADSQDILKQQMDTVASVTEISGEVRLALHKRLERSLQHMENEREIHEQQRAALDRKLAQQEAIRKLMEQTERDEEALEQLIERLQPPVSDDPNVFVEGGGISRVAVELAPYNGAPNLDVFNTAGSALEQSRRTYCRRTDNFLATLQQVERSYIPFRDESPIEWPTPERWQQLTENRGEWNSMDASTYSAKERLILKELDQPTTLAVKDVSLDEVCESIRTRHGIEIFIDKNTLHDENIATDTSDITLHVNEVSLKNALKLILDDKSLTYSIESEVLKITTKSDGGKGRVWSHNVRDLSQPINPLFGKGGGHSPGQSRRCGRLRASDFRMMGGGGFF